MRHSVKARLFLAQATSNSEAKCFFPQIETKLGWQRNFIFGMERFKARNKVHWIFGNLWTAIISFQKARRDINWGKKKTNHSIKCDTHYKSIQQSRNTTFKISLAWFEWLWTWMEQFIQVWKNLEKLCTHVHICTCMINIHDRNNE